MRHSSCVNIQLNLQFNHEYIFACEALRVLPLLKRIFAASHHQFKLLIHYYGNVCSLFTFTASKTINIKFIVPLEMLYILIKCLLNMTIANKQRWKKLLFTFAMVKWSIFVPSVLETTDEKISIIVLEFCGDFA